MRLIIRPDYEKMSVWAANHIARRIIDFKPTPAKPFVLGLPTGSSPMGTYRELIKLHEAGKLSFANVVTFNMDEYVGLSAEHPQSYHFFMWDIFFSHIDIRKDNVNIVNGVADDLEAECAAYEQKIASYGGIELFMGGIGPDGHLAFNEPGSSLRSRTRVKSLNLDTRVANSRFFGGDLFKVPAQALTVGVATITDAREVLIVVNGYNKARALRDGLEGPVSHMCILSCLQMHPKAIIVCDEAALGELRYGTVRYFMDIEKDNFDNYL